MVDIKLVVVGGDTECREFDLELPITIGRSRDASITLPHPLVSRNHCEIFREGDSIVVVDHNSLNGTFVGRNRVSKTKLNHGDLLTVGTVTFRALQHGSVAEHQTEVMDDTAVIGQTLPNHESPTVARLDAIAESSVPGA